jgi:HEPN domain-containing protein
VGGQFFYNGRVGINKVTAEDKFEYWVDIAEYDLKTAEAMLETGRWLYVVFMCQQAIEKLCKGLYVLYEDDNVPRVHAISQILSKFKSKLKIPIVSEKFTFYNKLTSFYLEGRYPEYKDKLSKLLDQEEAKAILEKAKEEFAWLLTLRPSKK